MHVFHRFPLSQGLHSKEEEQDGKILGKTGSMSKLGSSVHSELCCFAFFKVKYLKQVTLIHGCGLANSERCQSLPRMNYSMFSVIPRQSAWRVYISLGTRPSKNRKGGSGTSAGVEVYTAPGMKAHFRLAFD